MRYRLESECDRVSFPFPVLSFAVILDEGGIISANKSRKSLEQAVHGSFVLNQDICLPSEAAPVILPPDVHVQPVRTFYINQDIEGDGGV